MYYPPIASFLLAYFIIFFCFCHYISNHTSLTPPVVSTAPYLTPRDPIPKIIYTCWNSDKKPRTVEKCINSWIKNNPTYKDSHTRFRVGKMHIAAQDIKVF